MSEFALDQLKLAFAYHIAQKVVGADGDIRQSEATFLSSTFPAKSLESSGFVDAGGSFTDRYRKALAEALRVLPEQLSLTAKLELVETFLDASLADDEFHHSEGSVMLSAATALGVAEDELLRHLDTLQTVGSVDLPEPEA